MAGTVPTKGPLGLKAEKKAKPRQKRLANRSNKPKQGADPEHLSFVRSLPCCICHEYGLPQLSPTTAHHVIHGRYSTQKVPDCMTIPLCDGHHQGDFDTSKLAIHRGKETWAAEYGPDHHWINWVTARKEAHDASFI